MLSKNKKSFHSLEAPFRTQKEDSRGEDKHIDSVVVVQIWQVQSVEKTLLTH